MKKILGVLFIVIVVASCSAPKLDFTVAQKSEIVGTASPVKLNTGETVILLQDYINHPEKITSVTVDNGLDLKYDKAAQTVTVIATPDMKSYANLTISIDDIKYNVLLKKSEKRVVNYSFSSEKEIKTISIAGDMNNWKEGETTLEKNSDGVWQTKMVLNPGAYQYQVVMDGKWMLDSDNKNIVDNGMGGENSLLTVKGADEEKLPRLFTMPANPFEVKVGIENSVKDVIVYWNNFKLSSDFINREHNHFVVKIPNQAKSMKRSYIRVWASNDEGVSNSLFVPLESGDVLLNADSVTRSDKHAFIMYFLMVDRFFNGNEENDEPLNTHKVLPIADYLGGDIAGVSEKIDDGYFEWLGVNTIWLSPITQNPTGAYGLWKTPRTKFSAYHGYWPISNTKVDYRFGTDEELHTFVDKAHDNGMNVLLDYVANHVHENHPVYINHPDWATDLYLPDGTMNTEKWDSHRLTTWFDTFLPTLDLRKKEVREAMVDSAVYWVEEFNIDGFRHDATKHIPESFWRLLTRRLKEKVIIPEDKTLYQIGETYGSHELIDSYIGTGMVDGQFNFNMYDAAKNAFAKNDGSLVLLADEMNQSFKTYGYHNLMGYITGNQDKGRFISYAGGDLKFDEDAKLAGWTRNIGVGNKVGYKRLASMMAFNMTIPGVPVIYYGDEFGMPGGNDPDNRRMMRFENLNDNEKVLLITTQQLVHLRKSHLELIYGDTKILKSEKNVLAYLRSYFGKNAVVVFNNSNLEKEIELELPTYANNDLTSAFGQTSVKTKTGMKIKLAPNSFEIFFN